MKPALFQKRGRIILLATVAVVVTALGLAWPRGPKEPVYQGKRFTEWIQQMESLDNLTGLPRRRQECAPALKAIHAIGTNALPFLVSEFTLPISGWRQRVNAWSSQHPSFKIHVTDHRPRVSAAMVGMILLGSNAAPAIPVLVRYLDDPLRGYGVRRILNSAGAAAVPHLVALLRSPDPRMITNVLGVMPHFAYCPGVARDAVGQALRDSRADVRTAAVRSWSFACFNDENIVPDLLKLANDPSLRVVQEVSNQLVRLSVQGLPPISTAASDAILTLRTNTVPPRTN